MILAISILCTCTAFADDVSISVTGKAIETPITFGMQVNVIVDHSKDNVKLTIPAVAGTPQKPETLSFADLPEKPDAAASGNAVHTITIGKGEENIFFCPSSATAGSIVLVNTASFCDAALKLTVNGEPATPADNSDVYFWFYMPDEDAVIDAVIVTDGFSGS